MGVSTVGKKARVYTENTENAPRATEKKPTRFARSAVFFLGGSRWSSVFSVWNLFSYLGTPAGVPEQLLHFKLSDPSTSRTREYSSLPDLAKDGAPTPVELSG